MDTIKILNYSWHLSHQNSLFSIPATEWSWLTQYKRQYGTGVRGDILKKYNVKSVPFFEKGKYDAVLLHLDQQCFEDSLWERGKGSLFREVNSSVYGVPKIVIMHGTPFYPEMFPSDIQDFNYKELGFEESQINMSSELINRFKDAVKDFDKIVFNSRRAKSQWGFDNDARAIAIWHGLEATDWLDLPKEPRVVTMISPGGLDSYYDRTFLKAVKDKLSEKDIMHCHITVDVQFKSFDEYRDFLGRSLIYFNPTKESPMPRSRTEAMLSGCCVVTTFNQDSELFMKDGVNGFKAIRNPDYVVTLIEGLIKNYQKAIEVGQEGKKTALELFSKDRFESQWRGLLEEVTHKP